VAVVGAGGIGCPVSLYLAGAGVGLLGIFDGDVVELNNLHRQVGHYIDTLGRPKTDSLATTLHRINPQVQVNQHPFITKTTLSILDDYDVVIDGSDNPECRYLVNDYLMGKNKKLLSGACVGW
jgi:adenylyltransferase/sulfurtransferase